MKKLNIQRTEENKYVILFPYGPGSRATRFGLLYDASTDTIEKENEAPYLWDREMNDIKQLAKGFLRMEKTRSFKYRSGENNYIFIYESETSVIIFWRETNYWMKFTAECQLWNLHNDNFRLKPTTVSKKVLKKWPEVDINIFHFQKYKPASPPINGNWFEWDDEAH